MIRLRARLPFYFDVQNDVEKMPFMIASPLWHILDLRHWFENTLQCELWNLIALHTFGRLFDRAMGRIAYVKRV